MTDQSNAPEATAIELTLRLVHDPSAPLPWAVWADDDILGAGDSAVEAVADALQSLEHWSLEQRAADLSDPLGRICWELERAPGERMTNTGAVLRLLKGGRS